MGLQKALDPRDTGNTGNYTRVIDMKLNYAVKVAELQVALYNSQTDRDNNKLPLHIYQLRIENPDFDTYFADTVLNPVDVTPLEKAYAYIKTLSPWDTGTTDV